MKVPKSSCGAKKRNRRLINLGQFVEPIVDYICEYIVEKFQDRIPEQEIRATFESMGDNKIKRNYHHKDRSNSKRTKSSGYLVYQREQRSIITQQLSQKTIGGKPPNSRIVVKQIAKQWSEMSKSEKAKYDRICAREKVEKTLQK